MATNVFDLITVAVLGFGAYYLISGGKIPLIQQTATQQLPVEPEEIIPFDVEKRKTKKDDDDDDDDDDEEKRFRGQMQQPPPPQQQQYYPPRPPPTPQQYRAMQPPAPGMVSSLDYINIPQYPPYTSPTVGTYSPYSPYNQFRAYHQYYTTPSGSLGLTPDDNTGFTDIDTSKPGCTSCKAECRANRFGFRCASCRPVCKTFTHTYVPPQQGWNIGPAPGGFSFLASVWDTITGEPRDTFADMDDYHRGRRFDCHNKLKRRVRPRDNRFVTAEDYYYSTSNPLNQDINVE